MPPLAILRRVCVTIASGAGSPVRMCWRSRNSRVMRLREFRGAAEATLVVVVMLVELVEGGIEQVV